MVEVDCTLHACTIASLHASESEHNEQAVAPPFGSLGTVRDVASLTTNFSRYLQMQRMRDGDHAFFFKYFRMTPRNFDLLLSYVETDLTRQYVVREPLEPGERLAIALRLVEISAHIYFISKTLLKSVAVRLAAAIFSLRPAS